MIRLILEEKEPNLLAISEISLLTAGFITADSKAASIGVIRMDPSFTPTAADKNFNKLYESDTL
jgi:hypothetical protein